MRLGLTPRLRLIQCCTICDSQVVGANDTEGRVHHLISATSCCPAHAFLRLVATGRCPKCEASITPGQQTPDDVITRFMAELKTATITKAGGAK